MFTVGLGQSYDKRLKRPLQSQGRAVYQASAHKSRLEKNLSSSRAWFTGEKAVIKKGERIITPAVFVLLSLYTASADVCDVKRSASPRISPDLCCCVCVCV